MVMRILATLLLLASAALAADVSGNWKGTAEGPNGAIERTFLFKVDGTKLTGETNSAMLGKSVIQDGKIDGDNLSFRIKAKFQDNEMEVAYKGKVAGETIKLTSEVFGQAIEWTLKRAQ